MMITAATAGAGPAFLLEDQVKSLIADRRLVRVLADWYAPFPGYRLYYPTRHQLSPTFSLLVEARAIADTSHIL